MFFNRSLHMATFASISRMHRYDLDLQNAFRYGNIKYAEAIEAKKSEQEAASAFQYWTYMLLNWSEILGYGFSGHKPQKLEKLLNKYLDKKIIKIHKFVIKNFDDGKVSLEYLNNLIKDLFFALGEYIDILYEAYENKQQKLYTKLERDYYDYAFKEICAWEEE